MLQETCLPDPCDRIPSAMDTNQTEEPGRRRTPRIHQLKHKREADIGLTLESVDCYPA
jgi:hypothetical protein